MSNQLFEVEHELQTFISKIQVLLMIYLEVLDLTSVSLKIDKKHHLLLIVTGALECNNTSDRRGCMHDSNN